MSPHPFSHRNPKIKRICWSECLSESSRVHFRIYCIQVIIKPGEGFSESDRKIQMVCTFTCVPLLIQPHAVKLGWSEHTGDIPWGRNKRLVGESHILACPGDGHGIGFSMTWLGVLKGWSALLRKCWKEEVVAGW
jgi:hypothetical protein